MVKYPSCAFNICRYNCRHVFIFYKYGNVYHVVQRVLMNGKYYNYATYRVLRKNLSNFINTTVANTP